MQKEIEGYRLSPQQQRLCSLSQAEGYTPYRSLCAVVIEGGPSLEDLEAALDDVVARNEILRTTFKRLPGMNTLVQVINDLGARQVGRFDLSAASRPEQLAELERLFQDMKHAALDLQEGPLLHLKLIKLAAHENVLMLSLPALCTDRSGLTNLVDEIILTCATSLPHEPLDSPPLQYADVAAYLAELLESEETAAGRRYWSNSRMSDYPELRLSFKNQPAEEKAFTPESFRFTIDPNLIPLIKSAAEKYDTTASVFLLACWQVLLWRLTGQGKVLIGVAFPGRGIEGLEKLPGVFERYLPFAGQLESQLRFSELLKQLDELSNRLNKWQDYFHWNSFFLDHHDDGQPEKQFFPVCFEFDDRPSRFSVHGITRLLIKQYGCTERFKLKMSCRLERDLLTTEFHYDSHSLGEKDVECLADQFQTLLSNAINHLESPIERLELLSDSARESLLVDFNRTQKYILDERLEPVPQNVMGEIYIGGEAALARGYLGQADLIAERFIPNPHATEPGSLLYRTGDLGRHRADKTVEYCGRIDQQVKIREYMIDLGEIEAALLEHARVSEAVVVVNDDLAEKRLASYLVLNGPGELDTNQIKDYLKERLPDYMIPAVFIRLDQLPLTPNGKVDRRALPAPGAENSGLGNYVEPRTEVEKLIAGLWAKAFGLERVGINDDFFALGGDSILSIQLANRANNLGVRFTQRQIFQHRTIAVLAASLEPAKAMQTEQGIVTGAIPLTPIQRWFFEQNLTDPHYWNQAIMLETGEKLDAGILESVLQNLLVHHDALRLRFVRDKSGWQQFAKEPNGERLLSEYDLSTLQEEDRPAELEKISSSLQAGLRSLTEGRLMRAAIIDYGRSKGNLLLIVIHHLAVDVVSWSILLEGIETAYRQISTQQSVQLPARSSSFRDWAQRLTHYAQTPKLRRELAFWTDESRRKVRPVPLDFTGGDNTESSARKFSVSLTRAETKDLLQEVPRVAGTMINDLLLTALAMAFSEWTESASLLIDLENHGREELFDDIDLSRTIGWFTSIFPMLLDLKDTHDPVEALKAIKRQVRQVPRGGIGYGLMRYLTEDQEIPAQLKALPQAEISFNYVGRFSQSYSESSFFVGAREFAAPSHSPRNIRPYLIELNGGIDTQGQLQMVFTYSENLHRRSTIERFGQGFIRALMEIIEQTLQANAPGYNPSGFLVGDLSQMDLDRLMAEFSD